MKKDAPKVLRVAGLAAIVGTALAGCGGGDPLPNQVLPLSAAVAPSASATSQTDGGGQVSSAVATSGTSNATGMASATSLAPSATDRSAPAIQTDAPVYNVDEVSVALMALDRKTSGHEPALPQDVQMISDATRRVSQTWVAEVSGELSRVQLLLQSCSDSPSPLRVEIRRSTAPDAPIIAFGVVNAGALPLASVPCTGATAPVYWANVPLSAASVAVKAGETLTISPSSGDVAAYAWAGGALPAARIASVSNLSTTTSSASAGSTITASGEMLVWSSSDPAGANPPSTGPSRGYRVFVVPTENR